MPLIVKLILILLLGLLGVILVFGWWRTYKTQHSANQQRFLSGTLPNPLPKGFYPGTVSGYHGNWQGKTFLAGNTGVNIYKTDNDGTQERYPFTTSIGTGLRDKTMTVLKIDYNQDGNPWYARRVLDEVVQTAPGQLLGKIHVRVLPGVSFAVGYFTLKQK